MSEIFMKHISHHLIFFHLSIHYFTLHPNHRTPSLPSDLSHRPPSILPSLLPPRKPTNPGPFKSLPWELALTLLLAWGSCSANWAVLPEFSGRVCHLISPKFSHVHIPTYIYHGWKSVTGTSLTFLTGYSPRDRKIYPWIIDTEQSRGLACTIQSSRYPHCRDFINVTATCRRQSPQQRTESHDWRINYTSFLPIHFQTEGKINFLSCLLVSFVVGFQRVTRIS